jgi:uroporphyrinogen-III decarboxylase
MEKMTPYTRVLTALEGKKPDRVPVVPFAREWCSAQAGIEFIEELESVEKHVYSQTYAVSQFVTIVFGTCSLAIRNQKPWDQY